MKNNKYIITFIVLFLGIFILYYISVADFNTPPNKEDIILEKIVKLELKIDSINNKKDSIKTIIDTIKVKIITNEKYYQERVNTVMLQSFSADSSFITDYIKRFRSKNDSINIP